MDINERTQLTYALVVLAMSATLVFTHSVSAENSTTVDLSTQPHLKSWSNVIPTAKRFVVLTDFNNQAVLDRETGLVWERSPHLAPNFPTSWDNAKFACVGYEIGGRTGWRLPSLPELMSLIDRSAPNPPTLPLGHPFTNIQVFSYWVASARADDPIGAWGVDLLDGTVHAFAKVDPRFAWCVRGPMNADTY